MDAIILEKSELQENGCLKWTGNLRSGFPNHGGTAIRNYVWKKNNPNSEKVTLTNSCKDDTCINIDHLHIEDIWDDAKKRIKKGNIINEEGCHLWQKGCNAKGYGRIKFNGSTVYCHQLSYMIANGIKEIPEGRVIMNTCGKNNCNNTEHLKIGTHQDMADYKVQKGTNLAGEDSPHATITKETAALIKHSKYPKDHEKYKTQEERAEEFKVTIGIIRSIDRNIAWKEIPDRDGNTNLEQSNKHNELKRKRRSSNKTQEYTDEQFEIVREGLKQNSILTSVNKKGDVEGDCWENKNKPNNGNKYTYSGFFGVNIGSHVWSAMIRDKRKKVGEELVRHLCRNKICCNPDHVLFGTRRNNAIDGLKEENEVTKLNEQKVREIRKSSKNMEELVHEYGVSRRVIQDVLNNKSWTWVV